MRDEFEPQKVLYFKLLEKHSRRKIQIEKAIREHMGDHLTIVEETAINLSDMTPHQLALAIHEAPILLKSLSAVCNIAQRVFRLATGMNVDTYPDKISLGKAERIAEFLKAFLPDKITMKEVILTDQWWYIDKETRKFKGTGWEGVVRQTLDVLSGLEFKKRKFKNRKYEIDAAYPAKGRIEIGVDVKRIQSPRDIHKRSDEIINKAAHMKDEYPDSRFYAVIFYPFGDKEALELRFENSQVDGIFYAGESKESIEEACDALLTESGISRSPMDETLEDNS